MLWGNVVKIDFDCPVRLQKRAVRLLSKSPLLLHTDPVFRHKGLLKSNSILIFELCIVIGNETFELTPISTLRNDNTRYNSDIILTSVRTNVAANFVLYKGVNFNNSLPNELKCISDYKKFKLTTQSYLLNNR